MRNTPFKLGTHGFCSRFVGVPGHVAGAGGNGGATRPHSEPKLITGPTFGCVHHAGMEEIQLVFLPAEECAT